MVLVLIEIFENLLNWGNGGVETKGVDWIWGRRGAGAKGLEWDGVGLGAGTKGLDWVGGGSGAEIKGLCSTTGGLYGFEGLDCTTWGLDCTTGGLDWTIGGVLTGIGILNTQSTIWSVTKIILDNNISTVTYDYIEMRS